MADPKLPDVPVVRIVDSDLTMRMTEYVVLHVLMYHRRQRLFDTQQRLRMWHDPEQASKIANAMVDAYTFEQLNAKYQASRRAGDWHRRHDLRHQPRIE